MLLPQLPSPKVIRPTTRATRNSPKAVLVVEISTRTGRMTRVLRQHFSLSMSKAIVPPFASKAPSHTMQVPHLLAKENDAILTPTRQNLHQQQPLVSKVRLVVLARMHQSQAHSMLAQTLLLLLLLVAVRARWKRPVLCLVHPVI